MMGAVSMRLENFLDAKQLRLKMCGLMAVLALATVANAQQQKSQPAKAGVVSGSVFAITEGGDLKPARMADVYLLYYYRSVKWATAHPEDEDSAGHAWKDIHNKIMEQFLKVYAAEGMGWSDQMDCLKHLQVYQDALLQTMAWVPANHKDWQMLLTEADENGVFNIALPHPGQYIILASGRAGFNDAFWEADDVVVNPGATTAVKLAAPAKACATRSR